MSDLQGAICFSGACEEEVFSLRACQCMYLVLEPRRDLPMSVLRCDVGERIVWKVEERSDFGVLEKEEVGEHDGVRA